MKTLNVFFPSLLFQLVAIMAGRMQILPRACRLYMQYDSQVATRKDLISLLITFCNC